MGRLRRISCDGPGISRQRRGRGFSYRHPDGRPVRDPDTLARIRSLTIPQAWTDVWICVDPSGHLQATGQDAAGRRQYRYHDLWRRRRDAGKFDRMLGFASELPRIRDQIAADLSQEQMSRERALACAARLLDRASIRIGSEAYARDNGSFGLATLRRDHVRVRDDVVLFDFAAKSGQRSTLQVEDRQLARAVETLKRRRGGGPELLAYRESGSWRDVRSGEINAYIKALGGDGFSAKDFRTWHGTVAAAVALATAESDRTSAPSRRRTVAAAMRVVADFLGNTPAVARSSYVDPRLLDRFEEGRTISASLARGGDPDDPKWRASVERAVLQLLTEDEPAIVLAA